MVTYLKRLTFTDSPNILAWGPFGHGILRDMDNSLGCGVADLIAGQSHLVNAGCAPCAAGGSLACQHNTAIGIAVFDFSDCKMQYHDINIADARDVSLKTTMTYGDEFLRDPVDGWTSTAVSKHEWAIWSDVYDWQPSVYLEGGVDVEVDALAHNDWVMVRLSSMETYGNWHVWLPDSESFSRQGESFCIQKNATRLDVMPAGTEPHGAYFFDVANKAVHIVFRGSYGMSRTLRVTPDNCLPSGCAGPAAIPISQQPTFMLAGFANLAVAAAGNVTLPAGTYVQVHAGETHVVTGTLWIIGRLEVVGTGAVSITAANIVVYGDFIVGSAGAPYLGSLTVTLTGGRTGRPIALSESFDDGSGSFVCLGRCVFVAPPRTNWTRLGASAGAGSTHVTTATPTDWKVGEMIAVSSGGSYSEHIIQAAGQTLAVSPALPLSLYGAPSATSLPGRLWLDQRAEIALLNRTIVFTSHDSGSK